jgi:N utilization substance protein A
LSASNNTGKGKVSVNLELIGALKELERDRGIAREILLEAIEAAIVTAYKRNYGSAQNVRVHIDGNTGEIAVFSRKTVVEEVTDDATEIALEEAKTIDPTYQLGDIIEIEVTPADFGRIAAQTAKQVVIQRIREAERALIYEEYSNREGDVVTGIVQRRENRNVLVDLGKVEALLLPSEQIPNESYAHGVRLKVYITEVRKTTKGPQVLVSRTHPTLLKRLFELEVPEIHDGTVEIKGISREPGNRAKISVYCKEDNIDPVGACVGPRGMRVQSVVRELRGEKIDIIPWDPDPKKYVANALSPARVVRVFLDEEEKIARVVVPDDQLSLAIGKEGQNARLAAKLTGWKIDIKSETQMAALVLSGEDWEERTSKTTRDDEEPLVEPEEEEILPPEPEDSHKKKDDEWEERERRHVHSPRKKEKRRVLRDLSELTLIDFDFDE